MLIKHLEKLNDTITKSQNGVIIFTDVGYFKEIENNYKDKQDVFALPSGNYFNDYFEKFTKSVKKAKDYVYKFFLVNVKELKDFYSLNGVKANFTVISNDVKVEFSLNGFKDTEKDRFFKELLDKFSEYIYAEKDLSLKEQLVNVLKIRNLKLGVAESFTGGSLASAITSVSGSSAVFYEGVVAYNENAKNKRLGVSQKSLQDYKPVSGQVAYEMCLGLLKGECDLAISTTGIAGPKSDDSGYPVGLIYIGVGSLKKISVFKYQLTGSRKDICKSGVDYALFNAIMALRSNDYDV